MKKLFLLLALLLPAYAQAATYWVSTSGTDGQCTNSATPQTTGAELTINAGLSCMSSGDTLVIRAGTYAETINRLNVPSGTSWAAATTIQAYPGENAIITGTGGAAPLAFQSPGTGITKEYIILKGTGTQNLIFDPASAANVPAVAIGGGSNGGTLQFIRLDGVTVRNVANSSAIFLGDDTSQHLEIINSIIHDWTSSGTPPQNHGIYAASGDNLIESNLIYNGHGYGIHLFNSGGGNVINNNRITRNIVHDVCLDPGGCNGILVAYGNNNEVSNNLVYNIVNGGDGSGIGTGPSSTNALVYGNTVYNTDYWGINTFGSTDTVITNNIFSGVNTGSGGNAFSADGTGVVYTTNLCSQAQSTLCAYVESSAITFTTPGSDFHIKIGSAAVNHGTNLGSTYSHDLAGVARPSSGAWEIGAYETGNTFWVSTSGTDGQCTNSSTPQTTGAERTVNAGIGCLAGGDTLYIRTGSYVQPTVAVLSGSSLPAYPATAGATLISNYQNEVVTLSGTAAGTSFLYCPSGNNAYVILNGVIWDGANTTETLNGGCSHVRYSNMEIKNNTQSGVFGGVSNEYQHNHIHHNGQTLVQDHGMYISGADNIIEDNEIDNNRGCGVHIHAPSAINFRNIVRRNVVHDNGVGVGCAGILVDQGSDNQIYNNLSYNHNNGQGALIWTSATGTLVYNNTLYNNIGASQLETTASASGTVVKNNIIHPGPSGAGSFTDAGSGTTSSNNLCTTTCGFGSSNQAEAAATTFTTPGSNFHIKAGSLAINNGTNLGSTYSPDIADVARPTSGAWEIGAYEFTAATDAFARSNGALGTNWLSGYTGQTAGTIVSEQVQGTTLNSSAVQVWSTPATSDHAGSVTLAALSDPSGGDVAVILRASAPPTATFYYVNASIGTPASSYIYRCEAGSCTAASDNSVVWAAGDTLRATAVGETISVYRNGSLVFTYADTIPLRGNYVGFGSFAGSDLATMAADNFLIESLGGPVMHIVKIGAGQTLKIGLQ